MGLEEIFTTNANLSRMLDNRAVSDGLFVSKMMQKALIEVNEEGSEVAAATGNRILNHIFENTFIRCFYLQHQWCKLDKLVRNFKTLIPSQQIIHLYFLLFIDKNPT